MCKPPQNKPLLLIDIPMEDEVISGSSWAAFSAMKENYSWIWKKFHNNDCKQQIFEVLKVIASYKERSIVLPPFLSQQKIQRSILWSLSFIEGFFFSLIVIIYLLIIEQIDVWNAVVWEVLVVVVMGILFKVASSLACCERFSMGQARASSTLKGR